MNLAGGFEDYHRTLLGGDYEKFVSVLSKRPVRRSIRVNALKSSEADVEDFLAESNIEYAKIPWCDSGLWVSAHAKLNTMEHQLGWFFVQEAASMAPVEALGAREGSMVLDLCAAPGAKTTQLAAGVGLGGSVSANDDNYTRIKALVYNIQRCGAVNTVVSNRDGVGFEKNNQLFDCVLVDAPCSSVGTARKNPEVLKTWSIDRVERLSGLQKKLVSSAFKCLVDGGSLVYSTCTTSLEENERVVEHLLEKFEGAKVEGVKLRGLKHNHGLTAGTRGCARILPQHNDTESYFIARVVKDG